MKFLCKIFGHRMKRVRTIWPYEPGWALRCKWCKLAIDFTEDDMQPPERIFLQWYANDFVDPVTWNDDKIFDDDTEYVIATQLDIFVEANKKSCEEQDWCFVCEGHSNSHARDCVYVKIMESRNEP